MRPVVVMVAVEDPLPVPEAGLMVSQLALSLTVQLSVPPPVLEMASVWPVGLGPPCVAVNPILVGLSPMVAWAATVSVTVTV